MQVSADHPEEGPHLFDEELGLLECREVAPAIQLVPVEDVGES
jgi:hypothetical protein